MALIIYSDICIYREGLRAALVRKMKKTTVKCCSEASELSQTLATTTKNTIIIDLASRNSISIIERGNFENHKLVVLTLRHNPKIIGTCLRRGATGFLTRSDTTTDLVECVKAVARGARYYSPGAASLILEFATSAQDTLEDQATFEELTPRQWQIMKLMERGYTNKRIAHEMNRSEATIKNHVHNILRRLNVRTRGEAAAKFRSAYQPRH